MTIDLTKKRKLKELRALYQFDAAIARQAGHGFDSEQAELEVLASLHLSRCLQESIKDFIAAIDITHPTQLVMLGVVCNEPLGKIAGKLEEGMGSDRIDEVFQAVDEQRDKFRQANKNRQ